MERSLSLDFPVLGKVKIGSGGGGGGSVLSEFFEALGPAPKRDNAENRAMLDEPAESWLPPYEREQAIDDLPKVLGEDIDQLRQERDVLTVVNHAIEHMGVKSITEFADWVSRTLATAVKSGFDGSTGLHDPVKPAIAVIADYLRWLKTEMKADASRVA